MCEGLLGLGLGSGGMHGRGALPDDNGGCSGRKPALPAVPALPAIPVSVCACIMAFNTARACERVRGCARTRIRVGAGVWVEVRVRVTQQYRDTVMPW